MKEEGFLFGPPSGIKFPVKVDKVDFKIDPPVKHDSWQAKRRPPGSFVAIRPCGPEYGEKTYLGILIGWVPVRSGVRYDPATKTMSFHHDGENPAIYVFDLKRVILGCQSWWGPIKDESELRQITDGDIENVWYVKALKALAEEAKSDGQKS